MLKTILGNPLPESLLPIRLAFDLSIIALPIVVSILLAADTRFKAGNKWRLLRSTAEGFKREIYRFRFREKLLETTLAKIDEERNQQEIIVAKTDEERKQREAELAKIDRERKQQAVMLVNYRSRLQRATEDVTRRMMRTDVNESALRPYQGPLPPKMYGAAAEDDGFAPLDAGRYIDIRIGDQLSFYEKKTNEFEKQIQQYRWWILIYGGLGSLLVAARVEFLVPVTAAIVGALAAYLEYHGIEESLRKYNQTATNLANIRNKWLSYSPAQQATPKEMEWLLETTEKVLEYEFTGWVQQMQDILVGPGEKEEGAKSQEDEGTEKTETKGQESTDTKKVEAKGQESKESDLKGITGDTP
jgi:hypothetical protein